MMAKYFTVFVTKMPTLTCSATCFGRSMLMTVWELNRYTVQAGILDTYTDSNTRERRPYEADGLVEATAI